MNLSCVHDGSMYDDALIKKHGFKLNMDRDVTEVPFYDSHTGERTDRKERIFNFVGFVTGNNDDILVSLPKHYKVLNAEEDCRIVFDCIKQHRQTRPDTYIGNDKFSSNFPFLSFFKIYDYYCKYGLYKIDRSHTAPNIGGRVNWKETISRGMSFLSAVGLAIFPLHYRKRLFSTTFVTDCMIYAIDYTIDHFGIFINASKTNMPFPELPLKEHPEYVIRRLEQIRSQTFKDNEIELISNLIDFFDNINYGGKFYFKHYAFEAIWEDMVEEYLCKYYAGIDDDGSIIIDKTAPKNAHFVKESFHTNKAQHEQFISPDHYCVDGEQQLIFDAKYYTRVTGMNYKQICYMYMLQGKEGPLPGTQPYMDKTFSALILPSEKRYTKTHFQLNPKFGSSNFTINEEYLDTRDVIQSYINN